jgi:hypothetical protein
MKMMALAPWLIIVDSVRHSQIPQRHETNAKKKSDRMEQQQQQQVDQQVRQNWQQIRYQILDVFAQVSTADLDNARDINDLVQRIADITHHSDRFVENRLLEMAGAGQGAGQLGQSGQRSGTPFGQQQGQQPNQQLTGGQQSAGQQSAGQQQGQPFGAGRQ